MLYRFFPVARCSNGQPYVLVDWTSAHSRQPILCDDASDGALEHSLRARGLEVMPTAFFCEGNMVFGVFDVAMEDISISQRLSWLAECTLSPATLDAARRLVPNWEAVPA